MNGFIRRLRLPRPDFLADRGISVAPTGVDANVLDTDTFWLDDPNGNRDLLAGYLRARREVFIDDLGWELPSVRGLEFDQYDTPFTRYVVTHQGDEVLAGVRLVPTTARVGDYSYMIRDAVRGRLPGMPTTMLDEDAPVSDRIVEASRVLVRSSGSNGDRHRNKARQCMLKGMLIAARDMGADQIICILPAWWPRMARFGLKVSALGPRVEIGTPHQAVAIDVNSSPLLTRPLT